MTTTTDDKFTVVQNGVGRDGELGLDVPAGSSQQLDVSSTAVIDNLRH
jgi:hypothetical protein